MLKQDFMIGNNDTKMRCHTVAFNEWVRYVRYGTMGEEKGMIVNSV